MGMIQSLISAFTVCVTKLFAFIVANWPPFLIGTIAVICFYILGYKIAKYFNKKNSKNENLKNIGKYCKKKLPSLMAKCFKSGALKNVVEAAQKANDEIKSVCSDDSCIRALNDDFKDACESSSPCESAAKVIVESSNLVVEFKNYLNTTNEGFTLI